MAEDVELCLEIQMDSASKKILSNPEKCGSALLDVTVVKPKELEAFGTQKTNTLKANQVRKLIASMEKQRRDKQKIIENLKCDDTIIKVRKHDDIKTKRPCAKIKERVSSNAPVDELEKKDFIGITESVEPLFCEIRRSLRNVENRITNMQDINLVISETTIEQISSDDLVFRKRKTASSIISSENHSTSYVYRTDTAIHKDLKNILQCKNKNKTCTKGEKIEGKCLCENCGIIGLLTECQQHPLRNELRESTPPDNQERKTSRFLKQHEVDDKYDQFSYISQLSKRVKLLEERLAIHEERFVPKEYFKRIITKVVNNFSPKPSKSKSNITVLISEVENPQNSLKGNSKNEKNSQCNLQTSTLEQRSRQTIHCFHTNVTYNKENAKKQEVKNDKSTITDDDVYYSGNIWKWGEEILRPGIDLKNKIVTLLTDILSKFSITEKSSVDKSSKLTVDRSTEYINVNAEIFERSTNRTAPKIYSAQVTTNKDNKLPHIDYTRPSTSGNKNNSYEAYDSRKSMAKESKEYDRRKRDRHYTEDDHKNLDVSYMNPNASDWRQDSELMQKGKRKVPPQPNNIIGKQEFLRIIARAKASQKLVLWRNIWTQAEANGQTKDDKITIKIPLPGKEGKVSDEMLETELTIREVEEVLTR